ncbi:MAG: hypothetical protein AB1540_17280 [Bdellovibrionota bacterium]
MHHQKLLIRCARWPICGMAFESLEKIDALVFDKTGTFTGNALRLRKVAL